MNLHEEILKSFVKESLISAQLAQVTAKKKMGPEKASSAKVVPSATPPAKGPFAKATVPKKTDKAKPDPNDPAATDGQVAALTVADQKFDAAALKSTETLRALQQQWLPKTSSQLRDKVKKSLSRAKMKMTKVLGDEYAKMSKDEYPGQGMVPNIVLMMIMSMIESELSQKK